MKIVLLICICFLFGCSLKNPNDINSNKLFINIERQKNLNESPQFLSTNELTSFLLPPNASGNPQTIDDINCFAINVTGSGILPDNDLHDCRILQPFNMNSVGVGKISEMYPSGTSIQLDVQPGFNRRIDVYGVYPTNLTCNNNDEIPAAQKGFYLGGLTTDLLGDTSVSIPVSYDQNNPNIGVVCDKDLLMKFGTLSSGHRIYYSNAISGPATPTPYPTASPTPQATDVANISYGDSNYVTSAGSTGPSYGYVEVHFNVTNIVSNEYDGIEVMVNAVTNNSGTLTNVNAQLYNNSTPGYEAAVNNQNQFYITKNNLSNLNEYIWTDSSAQSSGFPYKFIVVKVTAGQPGTSYVASVNEVRIKLHKKPQ